MKQFWIFYTHNESDSKCLISALNEDQAIHNGLSLANYYHPNEEVKLVLSASIV